MEELRTDMAFGFQLSDLRQITKRWNRIYGSRLRVLDRMPEVLITGKDRHGRTTQIGGKPADVLRLTLKAMA